MKKISIILIATFVLLMLNTKCITKEGFFQERQELTSKVKSHNAYYDNNNDANFQSNVLNINRFYQKNSQDEPLILNNDNKQKGLSFKNDKYDNQPKNWKYNNDFVMNGAKFYNNVYGYDTLTNYYNPYSCYVIKDNKCYPTQTGKTKDDDLRMGLGTTNMEIRSTT
jgi:hypothetical protein